MILHLVRKSRLKLNENEQAKLFANEQLDDLLIDGRKIIQLKNKYKFTSDSVRLANFVSVKNNANVCEFCSGSGIISILVKLNNMDKNINLTMVELDAELCEASKKSVELNGFSDCISALNSPVQNVSKMLGVELFDAVVCNPPYFSAGSVKPELAKKEKAEITITLSEICAEANKLLKFGGSLFLVFPASRMFELSGVLTKNNFAVKRATLVKAGHKTEFKTILVEAKKGGKNTNAVVSSLEL